MKSLLSQKTGLMPKERKSTVSYEKSRLKELLWTLLLKYHPDCYLCKERFKKSDLLPSRGSDNLTLHHKDGNHENNNPENWSYSHRTCHKRFHSKDNILRIVNENKFWKAF